MEFDQITPDTPEPVRRGRPPKPVAPVKTEAEKAAEPKLDIILKNGYFPHPGRSYTLPNGVEGVTPEPERDASGRQISWFKLHRGTRMSLPRSEAAVLINDGKAEHDISKL